MKLFLKIHLYIAYQIFTVLQNHIFIVPVVNMTYFKVSRRKCSNFLNFLTEKRAYKFTIAVRSQYRKKE
jgi:hypothetical protein